jgi:hypothetical protein
MSVLDTATLGPIRAEPDVTAVRARIAREAIEMLAGEAHAAGGMREGATWDALALMGSTDRLARLVGLLK